MRHCLDDERLQRVLDGQAAEDERAHAAECSACRDRLAARRLAADAFAEALDAPVPAMLEERVARALRSPAGATTLRTTRPRPRFLNLARGSRWLLPASAVAAAIVAVVVFGRAVNAPDTVTAAEVLGRSLQALAAPGTGVESLTYDLTITGPAVASFGDASLVAGSYRIEQVIDHDRPGRFRFSKFAPGGALLSAISQDPDGLRRVQALRVSERTFVYDLALAQRSDVAQLPQWQRRQLAAAISLLQTMGDPRLTEQSGDGRVSYVVQVPPRPSTGAPFELHDAQVVVDGRDFAIERLEADGAIMGEPFRVAYALVTRTALPPGSDAAFEIATPPDAKVIEARGTANPMWDLISGALQQLH